MRLLRGKLRVRPDAHYAIALVAGESINPRWDGYRIELVHLPMEALPTLPWGAIYHPWVETLPGRAERRVVIRWRAWRPGVPGFAEAWWEPRRGVQYSVRNFDINGKQEHHTALLDHLRTRARTGGRRGPFDHPDECAKAIANAILELFEPGKGAQPGRWPRANDVELVLLGVEQGGRRLRYSLRGKYTYSQILTAVRKDNPDLY